ncbi:centrosomal protein of 95 kDa isoform X2 [Coturnix japonica]|uniref:centrosomal protein of 95 kDa isoform X2 n=1 Tax=Coturnix japonica TaxID=93934 RepID=UPI000776CAC6|nr:centrosomal protein of 95 kDa isoform X2 [Coturnix japonica]
MSSAERTDWVDVANDLLRSCHVKQHITHLSECGADVFVRLYESILGEKVPDFIATPRSQEDDAHNVQAVIDSLALDYLQVSLSHITGENIVKGERESIRNLLEIFDGLLEYLTEEASESSSQNGDEMDLLPNGTIQTVSPEQLESNAGQLTPPLRLSSVDGSQSECFVPLRDVDGSESTSELIRLGNAAYSFSERGEGSLESIQSTELPKECFSSSAQRLREPICQAVPLLPPFQPAEARFCDPVQRDHQRLDTRSAALVNSQELESPTLEMSLTQKSEDVSDVLLSRKNPAGDKMVSNDAEDNVKVPWVCGTSTAASLLDQKFSSHTEQITQPPSPESRHLPRKKRYEYSTVDSLEEPLSHRTTKENLSKQQLHQVSQNLSCRLQELDSMLKRALGGRSREEATDEDNLSQHSDSVMDYHRRKAERDIPHLKYPSRTRSLSPPSPSSQHQLVSESEDMFCSNRKGQMKKIRNKLQKERDERTQEAKMVAEAYENELRIYEAQERLRLSKLREEVKELEQEYKENIFKESPKIPQPVKVYSRKTTPWNPRYSQWIPKRGTTKPKKAAPMKVGDDDLLVQLLEEFPHLHISQHTMNKMWRQQLAQTQQLKAASGRARLKLQNEIQQALKKHELLAAIIKKDRDHNKRLQEFKQRIYRQKWTENKVREKRQQVVRARKYYEDYRVQLRAKMMRARTREERIFKNLFEEGLEIQKQRLKDLRAYAQEMRAEQRREHQNELESMENYYRDQLKHVLCLVLHASRSLISRTSRNPNQRKSTSTNAAENKKRTEVKNGKGNPTAANCNNAKR